MLGFVLKSPPCNRITSKKRRSSINIMCQQVRQHQHLQQKYLDIGPVVIIHRISDAAAERIECDSDASQQRVFLLLVETEVVSHRPRAENGCAPELRIASHRSESVVTHGTEERMNLGGNVKEYLC